jgi:hypothetical protein
MEHETPLTCGWQRGCQLPANRRGANYANRCQLIANCGANRCQPRSCPRANHANPSPIGRGWQLAVGGRCVLVLPPFKKSDDRPLDRFSGCVIPYGRKWCDAAAVDLHVLSGLIRPKSINGS